MGSRPIGAERRSAGFPAGGASAAVRLRRVVSLAVLAIGLLGSFRPLPLPSLPLPEALSQARHARVASKAGLRQATRRFETHALYALLEPLLDEDWPHRWGDPALALDCEAGQVTVDGAPLDVGAPVPDGSFTVRWRMQRCAPFGDATELSGDVVLKVRPSGAGYRAVVQPAPLHLASPYGHKVLAEPFLAAWSSRR